MAAIVDIKTTVAEQLLVSWQFVLGAWRVSILLIAAFAVVAAVIAAAVSVLTLAVTMAVRWA